MYYRVSGRTHSLRNRTALKKVYMICFVLIVPAFLLALSMYKLNTTARKKVIVSQNKALLGVSVQKNQQAAQEIVVPPTNPLYNKIFFRDDARNITFLPSQYRISQNFVAADALQTVADQPGTTWLTGPTDADKQAQQDITSVERTSSLALTQGTVPVYVLYALPGRDMCASYSKGGFQTSQDYLNWLERIINTLKTDTVFSVEPDAIAQTIHNSCISTEHINDRYKLINQAVTRLHTAPHVLAVYIDAAHSEWFPDPKVLVEPLKQAGIDKARGIAVNMAFFMPTPQITSWSQQLSKLLGKDVGVIIDTSRNGKGVPPQNIKGELRWCNPAGRGTGKLPTTHVNEKNIDAYFWGKTIGDSDGACGNYPAAGTFVPALALELAKNATP
jgi:endoglucanase